MPTSLSLFLGAVLFDLPLRLRRTIARICPMVDKSFCAASITVLNDAYHEAVARKLSAEAAVRGPCPAQAMAEQ